MQIMINTSQCPCRTLNDECIISNDDCYEDDVCSFCPLIRNGGVKLPKGHGRLFDERDIVNGNYEVIGNRIYELEPIIEADKEIEAT